MGDIAGQFLPAAVRTGRDIFRISAGLRHRAAAPCWSRWPARFSGRGDIDDASIAFGINELENAFEIIFDRG